MRTPLGEALAHDREAEAELAHEERAMEVCLEDAMPEECRCGYHTPEGGTT